MNAMTPTVSGTVLDIPLNKLKKSPKNARKTPHGEAAIEALAASIAAKGLLQAPVVEPELGEQGEATGCYLVNIKAHFDKVDHRRAPAPAHDRCA
jgi:ParB family transcriptional regulator, chromosome partitioning protein